MKYLWWSISMAPSSGRICFMRAFLHRQRKDSVTIGRLRVRYVVGNSAALIRKIKFLGALVDRLDTPGSSLGVWLRALRVHQYAKNVLIFVPLLTAHAYALHDFLSALLAFVAFSLCASSAYLL